VAGDAPGSDKQYRETKLLQHREGFHTSKYRPQRTAFKQPSEHADAMTWKRLRDMPRQANQTIDH